MQHTNGMKKQVPYKFDHLKNLRFLAVVDGEFSAKTVKMIVRFAIKNQLNMLCLLDAYFDEENREKLKVCIKRCQVETYYQHKYPALERHYLIFKRKFMQIVLLNRTAILRKSYWAERVVNFANCSLEEKI